MQIDLNADLGESLGAWRLGDDEAMQGIVTSANIACGFHAGDPLTLQRCCAGAVGRGVAIGAQVGYRDLVGFGRRFIDVSPDDLTADVLYQIGALDALARTAGGRVSYVKPHGALYNTVVDNEIQAEAVVAAVAAYDDTLPLLGLPNSAVHSIAERRGIRTVVEAFADRAYTSAGTLVPRSEPGAVLHDPRSIADRMLVLVTTGTLTAIDGTELTMSPESLCIHGDSPDAVAVATEVRRTLAEADVTLGSFVTG